MHGRPSKFSKRKNLPTHFVKPPKKATLKARFTTPGNAWEVDHRSPLRDSLVEREWWGGSGDIREENLLGKMGFWSPIGFGKMKLGKLRSWV